MSIFVFATSVLLSAFVAQDVAAFVPPAHHCTQLCSHSASSSTSLFYEYIQNSINPIRTVGGKNKKQSYEAETVEENAKFESFRFQQPGESEFDEKAEDFVPKVVENLAEAQSSGESDAAKGNAFSEKSPTVPAPTPRQVAAAATVAAAVAAAKEASVPKAATADTARFDAMLKSAFPGAISNSDLKMKVVSLLSPKGFDDETTLLCTSLCCDELARNLEHDLSTEFNRNFNIGGLAGFPFGGTTAFGAMAAHIPDGGFALLVHGPHVGITSDGIVGKVERKGIELVDTCCGSAIAASNYVDGITNGGATITTKIQSFTDFQQGAVRELILPHGKRLAEVEDKMKELPYALYESQSMLLDDIVSGGVGNIKSGMAILGGIQINTGPDTDDYFHPLRFDFMNNKGEVIEDLLPNLTEYM